MKRTSALLVCTVLAVSASLAAQSIQTASNNAHPSTTSSDLAITQASPHLAVQPNYVSAPFSRMAFGGGVSTMGVNMQIAVVANRYIKKGWDIEPAEVERTLGLKISWSIPNDFKTAISAINLGEPLVIRAPRTEIAQSMEGFAEMLSGRAALAADAA